LRRFSGNPDHYDLIITDMTMPHMTGDVLAEHMIKIRPDVPIIICSGYNDKLTEEKAREIGLKGFMMKPFVLKKMARLIRKVMDESKTET
jgi:DNA-binding NtrC family response regulator